MIKIVIEVEGGCLRTVCSSDPDTKVKLIDHDNMEEMAEPHRRDEKKALDMAKTQMFEVF